MLFLGVLPKGKSWSQSEIDWFSNRMLNCSFVAHVDDVLNDVHHNFGSDDFRRLEISMLDFATAVPVDIKTEMIQALGCRSKNWRMTKIY